MDVTRSPFYEFVFMLSCIAQLYVGLALGQFGKSIILWFSFMIFLYDSQLTLFLSFNDPKLLHISPK